LILEYANINNLTLWHSEEYSISDITALTGSALQQLKDVPQELVNVLMMELYAHKKENILLLLAQPPTSAGTQNKETDDMMYHLK